MRKKIDLQTLLKLDVKDMMSYLKSDDPVAPAKRVKQTKPKPFKQTFVVFDIGSTIIHVLVGKYQKDRPHLQHVFQFPTPIGCLEDGKILNEARLADTLSDALAQRRIKVKYGVITMNSSQIINRDLFIPAVEPEEMETVIRYELQQYLPINLADYQVRYLPTEQFNEQGRQRVFVSAYPERMLRSYYQVLNQAGLQPYALELPLIAIRKLFVGDYKLNGQTLDSEKTLAFLDLGHESMNISVYHLGNIDFTRLVRSGGRLIDEALRREGIKNEQLLEYKMTTLDVSDADFAQNHPEVKQNLDVMMSEVEKFLQFYRNNNQHKPIEHIYIAGGFAQIPGLEAYLTTLFKIPTELITEIEGFTFPQAPQPHAIASYVNAMSSFIRLEA